MSVILTALGRVKFRNRSYPTEGEFSMAPANGDVGDLAIDLN
jgi:hypothetical protein